MFELVQQLCTAPGIPGREKAVMDVIEDLLTGFDCRRDALGNLIVTVCAAKPDKPNVLFEAHADRIGLMVTEFLEDGFVRVTKNGGIDPHTIMGSEIIIEGVQGPVTGIVAAPFPHPAKPHNSAPPSEYKIPEFGAMFVDTGLRDPRKHIRLGAAAVLKGDAFALLGSRIAAPALDNRLSCATLVELARRLKSDPPQAGVTLLFATREEVGGRGVQSAVFTIMPDRAISIDTGFAKSPDTPEKDCVDMGKGPEIDIAALLDESWTTYLLDTAQNHKIPYQMTVFGRETGTDADNLAVTASGVPTALVSIPIRYMHHPVETADLEDVEYTLQLLAAAVRGL